MRMTSPRMLQWSLGLAVVLGLLLLSRVSIGRQPGDDKDTEKKGPTPIYYGDQACRTCHAKGTDLKDALCRCDEVKRWEDKDKHAFANKLIDPKDPKNNKAKRMGEIMKIDDVSTDKRCITCHGVVVKPGVMVDGSFHLSDGVSCVACHGSYREWVEMHSLTLAKKEDISKWRTFTRQEKEEMFGMKDLWTPHKRASLCLSCHVGNAQEGKVVTHAMYAAGHPPLPSVELGTFSEDMPRHWQYLAEKTPAVQRLLNFTNPNEVAHEQTKLVLIGGMASLREAVQLLSSQAGAKPNDKTWPELAQFDCAACHHELRVPGWRQKRGYVGSPGRPQMREWTTALARVALRVLGEKDTVLKAEMAPLYKAFDAKPFGEPADVATAAKSLLRWTDEKLTRLAEMKLDRAKALDVLRSLCTISKDEAPPDYDSARQLAWAANIVYKELYRDDKSKPDNHADIDKKFKDLDALLKLKLPSGNESLTRDLTEALKKQSEYDPEEFKKILGALLKLLPEKA